MNSLYPRVSNYFHLGRILKSHGTSGQMRLMVEERFKGYIKPGAHVFIDLDGSRVPFRIAGAEDGQHFVVTLEDVRSKEESDALAGRNIFIPVDTVKSRHLKSPVNLDEKWDDYKLQNEVDGSVYTIVRTEEYPQQLMAVIRINEREVLIPLNDQLITDIDHVQKVIRMEIPEGLLDL